LPVSLDCFCLVCLRLVYPMLPVSSRETGNIGYTRRRQTKQKQSRETGNIGYTRRRDLGLELVWIFVVPIFFVLCTLCCQFLWIVFVWFVFVLCTLCCQFL
jgi:hypothetical protein